MFKFLKEKLKSAISKISEGVEKQGTIEEKPLEEVEEKGFFAKIKEKFVGKEEEKPIREQKIEVEEKVEVEKEEEPEIKRKKIDHGKKEEHLQTKKPEEKIKPRHEFKEHKKVQHKVDVK